MDALGHFASMQMRARFAWGVDDCMTFAADWVLRVTGVDPMESVRGRYDTLSGGERMTGFVTDPLRFIGRQMEGFAVMPQAQRGDVGLVLTGQGMPPQGAVCLDGALWMARAQKGITTFTPVKVLRAWRVGLPGQVG